METMKGTENDSRSPFFYHFSSVSVKVRSAYGRCPGRLGSARVYAAVSSSQSLFNWSCSSAASSNRSSAIAS
jgi:hypothetical protein